MTQTAASLPLVTPEQRSAIEASPRTTEAHRALMAGVPAMSLLEVGGEPRGAVAGPVTVAAWNIERCLFPDESAAHLAPYAPQVILLSEVDKGMARTGQRNNAAVMAETLGMAYVFGVEFYELGLGDAPERPFCVDDFNADGWHGNAILSALPIDRVTLIRLCDHGHWFVPAKGAKDPGQPRLGGRMAIAAEVGGVCYVTTHLESNAGVAHRCAQFEALLDAVEVFAPGLPVVIGGDLNTGNHLPPDFDWRRETLFEMARDRGYVWDATPDGVTTRKSLITPHPTRAMKLDWFCTRGLAHSGAQIVPSVEADGRPLSDHDAVVATFAPAG